MYMEWLYRYETRNTLGGYGLHGFAPCHEDEPHLQANWGNHLGQMHEGFTVGASVRTNDRWHRATALIESALRPHLVLAFDTDFTAFCPSRVQSCLNLGNA